MNQGGVRDGEPGGIRRRVTRGYVIGLICAAVVLAGSLTVAAWGMLALLTDGAPVTTETVPSAVAPIFLLIGLAALTWSLWGEALALLRGRRTPSVMRVLAEALAGYLIWCLGGTLAGMSIAETWLSPYAWLIVPAFVLASLLFWAVLARRVYTDRPTPQWPWEKRGDPGPDTSWRDGMGPQS